MTNEQIIEKIKKLLALSSSPNENEARAAFQKAQQLISLYAVDITQENKVDSIQESLYTYDTINKFLKDNLPFIVLPIANLFSCHLLFRRNDMYLVGYPVNIEACKYACDCLINQGVADFRKEYKQIRSIWFAEGFWSGFVKGIKEKFSNEIQKGQGLILFDKVQAYLSKYKATYKIDRPEGTVGNTLGYQSGQNAQLRQGVKASNESRGLLK